MIATIDARILLCVLALGLILAGCSSSPQLSDNHHHRFRPGQPNYTVAPYQVNGVWYYPKADYGYDETGTASWYGPGFDGKMTSDGEVYDMNGLTAAHKTLPLPSVVQVTNLQNGRALQLRVNDRGPFVDGRIIDLSRRAAQLLGFEGGGTAPVRVRIMKEESIQVAQAAMHGETGQTMLAQATPATRAASPPAPPRQAPPAVQLASAGPASLRAREVVAAAGPQPAMPEPAVETASRPPTAAVAAASPRHAWPSLIATAHAESYHPPVAAKRSRRIFVQAGAFAMPENAQRARARIASIGSVEVVPGAGNGTALYRVRVGPVASEADAERLLGKVVSRGYPGARVITE